MILDSTTMMFVRDVPASVSWYRSIFEVENDRGGDRYDRLVRDGIILLRLHSQDTDSHPAVVSPTSGQPGHGVLLFLKVSDLEAVYQRALDLDAAIVEKLHHNEKARHRAFSLKDPDGYSLKVFQPDPAT
jgi:catechol 2,3-dioxygenase-like lactoylglutathione lyase family enzyme